MTTLHHHTEGRRSINLGGWHRSTEPAPRVLKIERYAAPALPALVDLRQYCSEVEDQGPLGSCTACGVVGAVEFNEGRRMRQQHRAFAFDDVEAPPVVGVSSIKQNKNGTVSFTTTITPAAPKPEPKPRAFVHGSKLAQYYWTRELIGTVGEDSGASITDAVRAATVYGVADESLYPYKVDAFTCEPGPKVKANAAAHKVTAEAAVPQDLVSLKSTLAAGYVIVFGFDCYTQLMSEEMSRTGVLAYPRSGETPQGGHCVVLVGYDDKMQAFLARNSWGADWAIAGYFWMPFGYVTNPGLAGDFRVIKSSPF